MACSPPLPVFRFSVYATATLHGHGLFTLANGIGMSGSSENGPLPVKKLKLSAFTTHTTTQFDSSTPSTNLRKQNPCPDECYAQASDEQGPTPFQPKDSNIIKRIRQRQGQKSLCFSSTWCVTYPWVTLYISSSSM